MKNTISFNRALNYIKNAMSTYVQEYQYCLDNVHGKVRHEKLRQTAYQFIKPNSTISHNIYLPLIYKIGKKLVSPNFNI